MTNAYLQSNNECVKHIEIIYKYKSIPCLNKLLENNKYLIRLTQWYIKIIIKGLWYGIINQSKLKIKYIIFNYYILCIMIIDE